ncbi:hypothetical protein PHMEG_00034453 [Phytophthora megakarya]|uniref:Uncharacterized protein n=1 Tax=Phytophthora megakarya TaxID=4795 RepID=A0A225USJ6_9STRA|nr:hypothetical protein PHMEG_00034453 [Phytophthora megakarya]
MLTHKSRGGRFAISLPTDRSINGFTNTCHICTPMFKECDTVVREILRQKAEHPGVDVILQAGDVVSTFRNVCTHSERAHLFGGRMEKDNALAIAAAAAFRWPGSPATYGVIRGAIAYIHDSSVNRHQPRDLFNYYWVDDHINVASDIGHNCADAETSLCNAMRLKILGLMFDTAAGSVAIPQHKIDKAKACVVVSFHADSLSRPM